MNSPVTAMGFSERAFCAHWVATLGLSWSSQPTMLTGCPLMPPAALMESAAASAADNTWGSEYAVPVNDDVTKILTGLLFAVLADVDPPPEQVELLPLDEQAAKTETVATIATQAEIRLAQSR